MSTARPWVERLCEAMDWGHVEGLDELLDDPPAHAEGGSGEALRDAWRAVGVLRRAVMRGEMAARFLGRASVSHLAQVWEAHARACGVACVVRVCIWQV